jgi:uridine phosphorylase
MTRIAESELILNKDGSVYHLSLLPEHLADTIITVGDPGRVHKVSAHFDSVDFEMNKREFITHTGQYKGKRITVISTGMGTDNIEILMNELDAAVNIDLKTREPKSKKKKLNIIRIGTSGSMQEDIPVGSSLVSDYGIGIDTLMSFYVLKQSEKEVSFQEALKEELGLPFTPYCVQGSTKLLEKIGHGMIRGNTVTCPGFYAPQGRKLRLELRFPKLLTDLSRFHLHDIWLTNFEMETAGYYAMGRLLGHEVLSVNAIIANRVKQEFAKNGEKIVDDLIATTLDRLI